jgi:IS6 family transposase
MATRPAIFKWRQTEPVLILSAVRWYLRYSLSLRDVEEHLKESGLEVDHTTVWRWLQRYGPELEERLQRHVKPTNKSWRVDETYIRVKVGATCIGPSIPPAPRLTFCCQRFAMPMLPNAYFGRR